MVLLLIYLHKILPKYKIKYQHYSNIAFLKNIDYLKNFVHFSNNHYGDVLNDLSDFKYKDAKCKMVKEIKLKSVYYEKNIEISKVFDTL